jgi:Flp pilus assembly protein TadD
MADLQVSAMTKIIKFDETEWIELHMRAVKLAMTGQIDSAIALINTVIAAELAVDTRAEILGFRADLHARAGRSREAITDYNSVLSLLVAPSYGRYSVEVALGSVNERAGEHAQATAWYRRALETALHEPDQTGATAVRGLAVLYSPLEPADRVLCERVARKAWKAAGLSGEPNLARLVEVADAIIESGSRNM